MSALLVSQPQHTGLRPVDLPRLRAVSNRAPIDVPQLPKPAPMPVVELSVVADASDHEVSRANEGLERLVGALKIGVTIAASVAFAFGLQLWLTI